MSIGVVYWVEEKDREREVKRGCRRCWPVSADEVTLGEVDIVSPNGVGHADGKYGFTYCGINATGDEWWSWWRT